VSKGAVIGVRTVELINIGIVIQVDGTFPKGFTSRRCHNGGIQMAKTQVYVEG